MKSSIIAAVSLIISSLFGLSFAVAYASTLSASCTGTPSAPSITWTASSTGGVAPVAFLWGGNGATSSVLVLSETPGTYSMSLQATDASSSIATTTCMATVAAAPTLPSISSFSATPNAITVGHSSVLSWTVSNASSTSINNGLGVVAGGSVVVAPNVTTTYELRAVNPNGTTTATATVTVTATTTTTGTGSALKDQIQALLQQIAALQQQIKQLVMNAATGGSGMATTTPPGGTHYPPGQLGKMACITLNRNLGIGSHGDDVKNLQEMLSEDRDSGFAGLPTGFFGALTAKSLQRYQMKFGIATSTGAVGPLTRGFFERQCGKGLGGGDNHSSDNSTSTKPHGNDNWHPPTSTMSTSTKSWNIKSEDQEGTTTHGNGHGDSHDY